MSRKHEKWKGFVSDEDMRLYKEAGFGQPIGMGERVALLNVDIHNLFIDPCYPFSAVLDHRETETALARLTEAFRRLRLPIYYVRRDDRDHPVKRGIRNYRYESLRTHDNQDPSVARDAWADEWPASYAPRREDVIVYKNKSSAFFATPLEAWLRYDRIDTLVVCGIATSGCVRATVTDAFAHNFRVIVAEDACADRCLQQHRANLFDMDMKLADVERLDDIIAMLEAREISSRERVSAEASS